MAYRLSLLDKSHIAPGVSGAEALAATVAAARRADELGYHRFWLAEHHGSATLASAAPEIMVAHILAQTRRIRVGSGGVLLQHYAPYKVAEAFSVLAALAPGRVDLGVGKSPGGLPSATRALQAELTPAARERHRSRGPSPAMVARLPSTDAVHAARRSPMTSPREPQQPARPHLPPAGWLPDPASIGVERYWNGSQWTQATPTRSAEWRYTQPAPAPPRRVSRGVTWLAFLTGGAVLVAGYFGALPAWVPWPTALTAGVPEGPEVAYPVFGSNETVEYLARSMVAQEASISLGFTPGLSPDEASDAVMEAVTQNPYVFVREWVIRGGATGVVIEPVYLYDDAEAEQRRRDTAAAVDALVLSSGALTAGTAADQIALLHDEIARTAQYDWEAAAAIEAGAQEGLRVNASQEAYGILVDRTAVCTGYAEAMQLAAHAVGIDSVVVTGEAASGVTTGGHAWNLVNLDGDWLVVDVTWDDAAVGHTGAEVLRHDYLLITQDNPLLSTRAMDLDWVVDGREGMYVAG